MPTVSVNLDTTQYVQVNSSLGQIILQSHRDDVRIAISALKPAKSNIAYHQLSGKDSPLQLNAIDTNIWALATTDSSSLTASEIAGGLIQDQSLAIPMGSVAGVSSVNAFGYAPFGVQLTNTDIWDRADSVPTQQIWSAPQVARLYKIVSDNAGDSYQQTYASVVRVWGIADWDLDEISEDIQLNGTTDVQTINKFIMIHKMAVIENGQLGVNAGTITATANVTADVVAQINPEWGQTQMAIYGIPSTKAAYLTNWYGSVQSSASIATGINFKLLYANDPATSPDLFVTREIRGLHSSGSSNGVWEKSPYAKFEGPGVLKIQAVGSAINLDATAGFDLILVDN